MSSAADQLADRLDHVLPPHNQVVPDQTGDPLVDTALRLARGPHPTLNKDQVARIEARILARAISPHTRRRTILQWASAACLIIVLITTGTARVSADSLPGEVFYPVKRLVERGRLVWSSDTGDVDLRLKFANRRLDEFETLLERGEINLDPLDDAIEEMHSALALVKKGNGARDTSVQQLVKLSSRQVQLAKQAENRIEQDAATAGELHHAAAEAEQVSKEARDLLEQPASTVPDLRPAEADSASSETAVIIPPEMVEQASSSRRLQTIPDLSETAHRENAAKPPVETPVPPPAATPVFVSLPPIKEIPGAFVPHEPPPVIENSPTAEPPVSDEPPTEDVPPTDPVVVVETPPAEDDDLDMASSTEEPPGGDPEMIPPPEVDPTVTDSPPTDPVVVVETPPAQDGDLDTASSTEELPGGDPEMIPPPEVDPTVTDSPPTEQMSPTTSPIETTAPVPAKSPEAAAPTATESAP